MDTVIEFRTEEQYNRWLLKNFSAEELFLMSLTDEELHEYAEGMALANMEFEEEM